MKASAELRASRVLAAVCLMGVIVLPLSAQGQTVESKIQRALEAAPPSVTDSANIIDADGTVLRAGSNGWTCMSEMSPGYGYPGCNDSVWMQFMKAIMNEETFRTERIGISYMLAGDAYVSNSDPFATDPGNGDIWVQEGPHVMILVPDPAMLEGIPSDPNKGGPYVMWKGTPYAHIMVPVEPRSRR